MNVGLAVLGVGLLVVGLTLAGVLRQRLIGLGLGAGLALFGAQQPLGESGVAPLAYLLTFALAVGALLLYQRVRTWMLLVAGVVGVTLAVPQAIWDVTNGAVGGAAILQAGLLSASTTPIAGTLRPACKAPSNTNATNRAKPTGRGPAG